MNFNIFGRIDSAAVGGGGGFSARGRVKGLRWGIPALALLAVAAPLFFAAPPAAGQTANSAPVFPNSSETREIKENRGKGQPVGSPVVATDTDGDTLHYSLTGTDAALFTIDEGTGQIAVTRPLDYETRSSYAVNVAVSDGKDAQGNAETSPFTADATVPVAINVQNVSSARGEYTVYSKVQQKDVKVGYDLELDPSPPIFDERGHIAKRPTWKIYRTVDENEPAGTLVGDPVVAQDPEQAGPVTYSLRQIYAFPLFQIDSATGQISTARELDYESAEEFDQDGNWRRAYWLAVEATDAGGQTNWVTVYVFVEDRGGEPPAPANLRADPVEEGLTVNWDAVTGATGYWVQWRHMLNGPDEHLTWSQFGIHKAALVAAGDTSYHITNLKPHVPYQVRVSARNDVGYGNVAFKYGDWPTQVPTGDPQGCVPGHNTPFFNEGDTATREVDEWTQPGVPVGLPLRVTINSFPHVICETTEGFKRYSFDTSTGDHAHFHLNTITGEIETKGALEIATKNTYTVVVQVTDSKTQWDKLDTQARGTDWSPDDRITVTINLTPLGTQTGKYREAMDRDESVVEARSRIKHDLRRYPFLANGNCAIGKKSASGIFQSYCRDLAYLRATEAKYRDRAAAIEAAARAARDRAAASSRSTRSVDGPTDTRDADGGAADDDPRLIRWPAVPDADADTYYQLRRRAVSEGSRFRFIVEKIRDGGPLDADGRPGQLAYLDNDDTLVDGQEYVYKVRTFYVDGSYTRWGPLDPGKEADGVAADDDTRLIHWPAAPEAHSYTYYQLRRQVAAAGSPFKVIVKRLKDGGALDADDRPGQLAYRDNDDTLVDGQEYVYEVRTFYGNGRNSGWERLGPGNEAPAYADASMTSVRARWPTGTATTRWLRDRATCTECEPSTGTAASPGGSGWVRNRQRT
jgi:hypothetical protein